MATLKPALGEISRMKVAATLLFTGIAVSYIQLTPRVRSFERPKAVEEINVAVSPTVQIVLSGGDPFLAANLAVFRATFVGVQNLDATFFPTLAKVQNDASFLNPAQEDNYYIAQGILPWIGEYSTAMNILHRATDARPYDFMPPFFLGFDYMYFESKFEESGHFYHVAADRVEGKNRDVLLNYAAKFMEKGKDPESAIQFIEGLIKATRNKNLQQFLRVRIIRLQRLIILREAAEKYSAKFHRQPSQLNDLVDRGILPLIPADPLGGGYMLDENGIPQIVFQINRIPK